MNFKTGALSLNFWRGSYYLNFDLVLFLDIQQKSPPQPGCSLGCPLGLYFVQQRRSGRYSPFPVIAWIRLSHFLLRLQALHFRYNHKRSLFLRGTIQHLLCRQKVQVPRCLARGSRETVCPLVGELPPLCSRQPMKEQRRLSQQST